MSSLEEPMINLFFSLDNLNNQSLSTLHSDDLALEVTADDVINVNISFPERIERLLSVSLETDNIYGVVVRKFAFDGSSTRTWVGFRS